MSDLTRYPAPAPSAPNDQHLMVHSTPTDHPAPANLPETAPLVTITQPTEAVQSPAQTASDDPSANTATAVDQPHSEAGPQAVRPGDTQDVSPSVQAAQLEHTSSTTSEHGPTGPSNNCALAGGNFPQAPAQVPSPKPARKSRRKKRDNHFSARLTEDEIDILTRRMELTGETMSEAFRAIIRESASETKGVNVSLTPKTPPVHFEKLLGDLHKLHTALATAKPRLNIPTPADDDERYEEVTKWRKESDKVLVALSELEEVVKAGLSTLTCLTPERIKLMKLAYPVIKGWEIKARENPSSERADTFLCILHLIEDMGIIKPEDQ